MVLDRIQITKLAKSKKDGHLISGVRLGGEREIRTLGTFIGFTRFPVVRLRPAQPSLQISQTVGQGRLLIGCLFIIRQILRFVKRKFPDFKKVFRARTRRGVRARCITSYAGF